MQINHAEKILLPPMLVVLFISLTNTQQSSFQFCFLSGHGGLYSWNSNCNFRANVIDINNPELVNRVHLCLANPDCTHFFVGYPDRSCRLKSISRNHQLNNFVALQDEFWAGNDGPSSETYCGFIPSRTYDQGFSTCNSVPKSINTTTCELDTLSISCPSSPVQQKITILGANYGRYSPNECPGPNQHITSCDADVTNIVRNLCNGKTSFQAVDGLFLDPCPGTWKYLTMKHYCA